MLLFIWARSGSAAQRSCVGGGGLAGTQPEGLGYVGARCCAPRLDGDSDRCGICYALQALGFGRPYREWNAADWVALFNKIVKGFTVSKFCVGGEVGRTCEA